MNGHDSYWARVWFRVRRMLLLIAILGVLGGLALALSGPGTWLRDVAAVLLGIAGGCLGVLPFLPITAWFRTRRQ